MPRLGRFGKADAVEIIPGLYIGSVPDRRAAASIAKAGVTHVVDLRVPGAGRSTQWPPAVRVESWGLTEYAAPEPARLADVARRTASLLAENSVVFVHCREGIQRAPMVACAALMDTGWSLADAFRLVSARRPVTAISEGQLNVLRELDAQRGASPLNALGVA